MVRSVQMRSTMHDTTSTLPVLLLLVVVSVMLVLVVAQFPGERSGGFCRDSNHHVLRGTCSTAYCRLTNTIVRPSRSKQLPPPPRA